MTEYEWGVIPDDVKCILCGYPAGEHHFSTDAWCPEFGTQGNIVAFNRKQSFRTTTMFLLPLREDELCKICGERYGSHGRGDDRCPLPSGEWSARATFRGMGKYRRKSAERAGVLEVPRKVRL